ncbi:hypothetical protein Bca52824_027447 [Brassica carinata]|uniref:Uncharacterized protein n=1 Tax=Brassica carinata TaxID=52824 RepID=A0A8X7VAH9_BRACI|nr:hypothetical protein Bca52824_027447 [Brassica carinata]
MQSYSDGDLRKSNKKGRYKAWDSLTGMQRKGYHFKHRSLQMGTTDQPANCGHLTPHELKERQVRLGNARPAIEKILTVYVMRHMKSIDPLDWPKQIYIIQGKGRGKEASKEMVELLKQLKQLKKLMKRHHPDLTREELQKF